MTVLSLPLLHMFCSLFCVQEKAKTGLARLWARFKKAMKGPLQTSGLGDVGGVKGRRKKKLEATSTSPPTQTSH